MVVGDDGRLLGASHRRACALCLSAGGLGRAGRRRLVASLRRRRPGRRSIRPMSAHATLGRSDCRDRCTAPCCSTKRGAVLRPSIIWCDQRTDAECRGSTRRSAASGCCELTLESRAHQLHLTKLLWVRTHEPEIWQRVRHVLLPKDYVRFRLSGEYAIDVADASGTLMLDVARRQWSR